MLSFGTSTHVKLQRTVMVLSPEVSLRNRRWRRCIDSLIYPHCQPAASSPASRIQHIINLSNATNFVEFQFQHSIDSESYPTGSSYISDYGRNSAQIFKFWTEVFRRYHTELKRKLNGFILFYFIYFICRSRLLHKRMFHIWWKFITKITQCSWWLWIGNLTTSFLG